MKIQNSKTSKVFLALAAFATVGLASCSNGEKEKVIETQTISIQEMKSEIAARDSAFNEVLNMLNQVEDQVATIVEKENLIANTQQGDNANNKDKLLKELALIDNLVAQSNHTIDNLKGRLRNTDLKLSGFQKRIDQLTADLEQRSTMIAELRSEVIRKDAQINMIAGKYDSIQVMSVSQVKMINAKDEEIDLLTSVNDDLNTVRYAVGSFKDLKERGLVSKEGGFLWFGRSIDLNESVDSNEYIEIDIREFSKLPIEANKVELVTDHPADSYVIVQDENEANIKYLEITDPKKFWKVSKYLVISTKS
ncbi:Cbp1 family collagen-binding glycoprotein adhesin [Roseivirga echinicomitans]